MTTLISRESSSPASSPSSSVGRRNDNEATKVRQRAMLDGPVLSTLLKLALPTVVVLVVQTLVGWRKPISSAFSHRGHCRRQPVFPIFMLMQMMSNGGIGGGVASSIARAMGAGKVAEAEALTLNALVLAVVFGVIFAGVGMAVRRGCLPVARRSGRRPRRGA